jgi:tetratricopeptide (TPR) repeat protein
MILKNCFLSVLIFLFSCNNRSVNTRDINKGKQDSNIDFDRMADKFYKEKKYFEAKQFYDTLILNGSSKGEYYARRGYCNARLGDLDAAKNDYLKTLNFTYDDKKTLYVNLGMIYRFNHKYDSAIYFYDECLKLDSTFLKAKNEKKEVNSILQIIK